MEELAKWLGGLATGVALVLVTQAVTHLLQRSRTIKDRLMDRYAELAGVAVEQLDRARDIEAQIALMPSRQDQGYQEWKDEMVRLILEKHNLRRDIARLALQIRMLEHDEPLREQVKKLAKDRPFIVLGGWMTDNFNERFEKYREELRDYARLIDSLTTSVLQKHAQPPWQTWFRHK